MTEERLHSDPLLPVVRERFGSLRASSAFPPLALSIAMFCLAFLFGDRPDLDFGFGSPYDEPEVIRTTTTPVPVTIEPEETTTTVELVQRADLDQTVAAAGFPAIETSVSGSVVTVRGTVPDEASRRVVLDRVAAVAQVTEVIDELVVQAGASASSAAIDLARSRATLSGVVADQAAVDRLLDLAGQFYLPDQVDADGVTIDPDAAPLTTVGVSGTLSDQALLDQIEQSWSTLSSLQVVVDLDLVDQPRVELELDELLAVQPIEFNTGQATITLAAADVLDEVATILVQFPAARIEVGGHTDSQGGDVVNQTLSEQRASTVVAELRARGVENDLVAVGYGALRPRVALERTDADQAANRRIEFRLL